VECNAATIIYCIFIQVVNATQHDKSPSFCYRRSMTNNSSRGGAILGICITFGAVIGSMTGNVGLWVALGIVFGVAFAGAARRRNRDAG
jgi:hypothetical protein